MNLKSIMLSGESGSQKLTSCMILLLRHPGKGRTIGVENRSAVARGWTRGERLTETGQPERVSRGDRTALYTDCGGDCSHLYMC